MMKQSIKREQDESGSIKIELKQGNHSRVYLKSLFLWLLEKRIRKRTEKVIMNRSFTCLFSSEIFVRESFS